MILLEESVAPIRPKRGIIRPLAIRGSSTRYLKLERPENPDEVDICASMLNHGNPNNDVGLPV